MGEIAEALKRQREERDANKSAASPPAAESTAPVPPGRSELLEALKSAPPPTPRPGSAPPHPPTGTGTTTASALAAAAAEAAAEADRADAAAQPNVDLEAHEIDEESLSSVGKVDLHRQLALQVAAQLEHRNARSLAVVSALRDEGKTTVAATLAMALASVTSHRCVALVDLDMRNPSVARRLGLPLVTGVESYLLGRCELDAIRIPIATPLLDVYPSVEHQPSAHELLARPQLASLIEALEQRYQTVIIDTPPTLIVPDASMLLKRIGCCVAVARAGVSRARRFQEMLDILPDGALMGKVLNSANLPSRDQYYYEYGYRAEEPERSADQAEEEAEKDPVEVHPTD